MMTEMKPFLLTILFLLAVSPAYTCPTEIDRVREKYKMSRYEVRLLKAIYKHENCKKPGYCQAVLAPKYKGCNKQVKRCLEIIRQEWKRWDKQGRPGSFIKKLGLRYCPPRFDEKGHFRWVKGIGQLMKKKG